MKNCFPTSLLAACGLLGLLALPLPALAQLTITGTSPVANARAVPAAGPVSTTFNQALTAGSTAALKVFSAQRGGLRPAASGTTSVSGSTVSFAPTYAFRPGETVQATVTTAATAAAGGSLTTPQVLQYTTAAGAAAGAFNGTTDVAVGGAPYSVVAADVDGDGDLDILTANPSANTVSVRLNSGTGTFSGMTDVAFSNGPENVAVADVDGDGDLDILAANAGAATVRDRKSVV